MYEFSREKAEGERKKQHLYEEFAYVIDFLPHGRVGARLARPEYRARPCVQLVGEKYFTLLEAVVREGVTLKP